MAGNGPNPSVCNEKELPRIIPIDAIDQPRQNALPPKKITCDPNTRTVRFELEPNKAAALFAILNYGGFRTETELEEYHVPAGSPMYSIQSFSLESKYGKVQYSGAQVTRDFVKQEYDYVLTYK
jgi:hypothetical protein